MQWIKDYFELCSRTYLASDRSAFSGETRLCLAVCGHITSKPGIRQQKQTPGHSHICPNKMNLCSLLCSESRTIFNYAADQLYLERPVSAWPCVHAIQWDHSPCMLGLLRKRVIFYAVNQGLLWIMQAIKLGNWVVQPYRVSPAWAWPSVDGKPQTIYLTTKANTRLFACLP